MEPDNDYQIKGPQDILLDLPQERLTSITRGRGPRRGNLERLLRYWRPIMKKPGGFTRCRVILANHPELYPLERICAWLHHETTGKWPNEGCHHPGMKNCKGKLRKVTPGWTDAEWGKRMRKRFKKGKKDAFGGEFVHEDDFFFGDFLEVKDSLGGRNYNPVVTDADFKHASGVLRDFVDMEPDFVSYIRNFENWEIEGEDEGGGLVSVDFSPGDCGCE
tara:strand:+ start:146 stop:802 length:657 start_codon:yes stop_codon:yes gene_type:complete